MAQREVFLQLWREEREQIRHRLRLAVLWSAACLIGAVFVVGVLVLAGREISREYSFSDVSGPAVTAAVTLVVLGALGLAHVTACRRDAAEHTEHADAFLRQLDVPRSEVPRDPAAASRVTAILLLAHLTVLGAGLLLALLSLSS